MDEAKKFKEIIRNVNIESSNKLDEGVRNLKKEIMDKKDADYLNFFTDYEDANISFEQRLKNPYYYYLFALEQLNKLNCLSVLDMGCADGTFSKLCQKQGLTISGVDYSKKAREAYEINTGITAQEVTPQTTFDAVVMLEIIEHIEDPLPLVQEAYSTANKILIFTVPIKDALPSKFHKKIYEFYDIFNMCSTLTNNFKIYSINKFQKTGNPLNIFAAVLYK